MGLGEAGEEKMRDKNHTPCPMHRASFKCAAIRSQG